MRRRIPLAPAEGWVTLGLVIVICLTMAWALDDARWVLGQAKFLDYLVVAAIGCRQGMEVGGMEVADTQVGLRFVLVEMAAFACMLGGEDARLIIGCV